MNSSLIGLLARKPDSNKDNCFRPPAGLAFQAGQPSRRGTLQRSQTPFPLVFPCSLPLTPLRGRKKADKGQRTEGRRRAAQAAGFLRTGKRKRKKEEEVSSDRQEEVFGAFPSQEGKPQTRQPVDPTDYQGEREKEGKIHSCQLTFELFSTELPLCYASSGCGIWLRSLNGASVCQSCQRAQSSPSGWFQRARSSPKEERKKKRLLRGRNPVPPVINGHQVIKLLRFFGILKVAGALPLSFP